MACDVTRVGVQSDVSKRKDDSTVASKIQSFIPGNLIVVSFVVLPSTV